MSPQDLATLHSQIIDQKLGCLTDMCKAANVNINSKLVPMLSNLELDKKGKVAKTSGNRKMVNTALALARKEVKDVRRNILLQYEEGSGQIEQLANTYINTLKGG